MKEKIKCLVVDDERLARALMENFIGKLPRLELVEQCKNPIEAIACLQREEIDLMFLDIQMPDLTGIELLKTLKHQPITIFTTAYSEYALEGYQLNIMDYLLKPFSFNRFVQAVNKAIEHIELKDAAQSPAPIPQAFSVNPTVPNKEKDFMLIKADHKVHKVKYADILYIQSMREYAAFYTTNGRIIALNSLKKLETELPKQFLRIHKSYIIASEKVTTLEGNMVYIGDEKLPIGNFYRDAVMKRIFS